MKTHDSFFLPYQKRWIEDTSRLKIMEKSRQVGLSWASAYGLVRDHIGAKSRLDTWVSSRDEIQARLFLEDCQKFARVLDLAAQDVGKAVLEPQSRTSAYTLELKGGTRIHSLTSNADAQAGKRGTRFLDEFALHPDPRRLYGVAYPGITWGGRLEIVSTHRGAKNYFNTLIEEIKHKGNPKNFSYHRVTLEDALAQGFLQKLKEKLPQEDLRQSMDAGDYYDFIKQSCPDEETFQEEYLCIPSDDQSAFLSHELITRCERRSDVSSIPSLEDATLGNLYLGVDVGRTRDLTVFWLLESVGDVLHTRSLITLEAMPFSEQEAIFYSLLEHPKLRRACVDQTGLGRQFAERAIERFGAYKVEGVNFTSSTKEWLAYPVRAAFEAGSIRIPEDRILRADLRAVKKEVTHSGNIRFTADRGPEGHADRFWALALALHASGRAATATYVEALDRPMHSHRFPIL
jgi:phage FluMu gp28-like protein